MSRTTIGIAAAAVLIAGLAIGSAMMFSGGSAPPPARKSLPVKTGADQGPQTPSPAAFPLPPALPSPEQPPAAVAKAPPAAKKTDLPAAAKQPPAPQRTGGKPPALFPDAREALSEVGVNPEAEAIWLAAIADPNCPAEERKDLIEDLNEDGLPSFRFSQSLPGLGRLGGVLRRCAGDKVTMRALPSTL